MKDLAIEGLCVKLLLCICAYKSVVTEQNTKNHFECLKRCNTAFDSMLSLQSRHLKGYRETYHGNGVAH